jgi:PAS domain-containing protein/anti-sigma regulatory factor (Ser/Thr protein kinase)
VPAVFARYVYYVDHAGAAAFLWTPGSGIVHANALARVWTADIVQNETLDAAAAKCAATQRASVTPVAEGAFLLLPLLEGRDRTQFAFGIEGRDLADAPRLLHELYETPRHFSNVVHSLPQIVLTAQPNGDFDYASNQWYKATGSKLMEARLNTVLRNKAVDPPEFVRRWEEGVASGEAFGFEFRLSTVDGERWYALRAVPSYEQERLRKWVASLDDIDDLVRSRSQVAAAAKRLKALAEIGALALDRDLSEEELLRRGLGYASQAFDALWLASLATHGETRLVAHQSEARLFARVFSEGPAVAQPRVSMHAWNDEAPRPVLRVPLRIDGEVQPGIAVIGGPGAQPFDELDIHLAREVTWRIENALGNLIASRREARIASVLQTALLPVTLPQPNGLSFDVAYRSADVEALVGGDWYDAIQLADGRVAFSIGDVGGHGLNAAFIMGHVREMVRTGAMRGLTPHEVFAAANETVIAAGYGLISAFLGYIDPLTLDMQYAVAGHPAPLLVTREGTVEALCGGDEILGATSAARYHTSELTLAESNALVLYTDGVVEHSHDIEAGEMELQKALAAWGQSAFSAYALEILTRLLTGKPIRDDAALLILRPQPIIRFEETLPADPATSRRARRVVRRALEHSELGSRSEEFVLAMCEAINNAIEHGSPAARDRVHLLLELDDGGIHGLVESVGPWQQRTPSIERGRGLMLMRAFCDRLEVDIGDRGTTVDLYMHAGTGEVTARSVEL